MRSAPRGLSELAGPQGPKGRRYRGLGRAIPAVVPALGNGSLALRRRALKSELNDVAAALRC